MGIARRAVTIRITTRMYLRVYQGTTFTSYISFFGAPFWGCGVSGLGYVFTVFFFRSRVIHTKT
jgi:hypothetical protein